MDAARSREIVETKHAQRTYDTHTLRAPKPRKIALARHTRDIQVHVHARVARAVRRAGVRYIALKHEDIARTQYNGHGGVRTLIAHCVRLWVRLA